MNTALFTVKLRALLTHSFISFAIVAAVFLIIYFFWYSPPVLFFCDGGLEGLKILAPIEILFGPALTFVVFRPGKPKLKQDLAIIAILQFIALISGLYVINSERPLAIAHLKGVFYTANAISYDFYGLKWEYLNRFDGSFPKLIYIDPVKHEDANITEALRRAPDRLLEKYAHPANEHADQILQTGQSLQQMIQTYPNAKEKLEKSWKDGKTAYPDAKFFLLRGKYTTAITLFDATSQQFISAIIL